MNKKDDRKNDKNGFSPEDELDDEILSIKETLEMEAIVHEVSQEVIRLMEEEARLGIVDSTYDEFDFSYDEYDDEDDEDEYDDFDDLDDEDEYDEDDDEYDEYDDYDDIDYEDDDDDEDDDRKDSGVEFTCADGSKIKAEYMKKINFNGNSYVAFSHIKEDNGFDLILRRINWQGSTFDEKYVEIEDHDEWRAVYNIVLGIE